MGEWNKYWVWNLPTDQLERILMGDAKHEHPFAKFCIREAMMNRRAMEEKKKSDEDILEEDLF